MNTQAAPSLPLITCNQDLFDHEPHRVYARRQLYHATVVLITSGIRFRDTQGHYTGRNLTSQALAQHVGALAGYGLDAAYDRAFKSVHESWELERGPLPILDKDRINTIGDYRRYIQANIIPSLADTLDRRFSVLTWSNMPSSNDLVPVVPVNDPWSVRFRSAVILKEAEGMRAYPLPPIHGVSVSWNSLNADVIEEIYRRTNLEMVQAWDVIFVGRYRGVYRGVRVCLQKHALAVIGERARQRRPDVLGTSPRTITPSPPGSNGGSPRSVASGYDPTSDMDISPNAIGY